MDPTHAKQPRRPAHLPDYADASLQALVEHGLGDKISLGGALGLLHYLDYRPTHDVDAWWTASATAEDQRQVIRVIETTLAALGQVKTRAWGDVVSIELRREESSNIAPGRRLPIPNSAPKPNACATGS